MNNRITDRLRARLVALRSPKLLALGVPLVFLGQCAPDGCAPVAPAAAVVTVTDVVDGDTVDLSTGARVRIIGIDTPEVGTCGAAEATARMEALVLGQAVSTPGGAHDGQDRYGRSLRYVDVNGVDAGRTLIGEGLAVARYDSRDGYGGHPREADYVAADAAIGNFCGCGRPPGTNAGPDPAGCGQLRCLVPDGVHPVATARLGLRRHPAPPVPSAGTRPARLRRQPRRRRLRELTVPAPWAKLTLRYREGTTPPTSSSIDAPTPRSPTPSS